MQEWGKIKSWLVSTLNILLGVNWTIETRSSSMESNYNYCSFTCVLLEGLLKPIY